MAAQGIELRTQHSAFHGFVDRILQPAGGLLDALPEGIAFDTETIWAIVIDAQPLPVTIIIGAGKLHEHIPIGFDPRLVHVACKLLKDSSHQPCSLVCLKSKTNFTSCEEITTSGAITEYSGSNFSYPSSLSFSAMKS